MSKIIVGVDESDRSKDAAALAALLARGTDAEIVLVCAYPYDDLPGRGAHTDHRRYLREDAEAALERAKAGISETPRMRTLAVAEVSPAKGIQAVATQEGASLIVIGSSGRGDVGRVFAGTTAERLLHGAPCAVAVVPHGYRTSREQPIRRIGVAYDGSDAAAAAVAAAIELARALSARLEIIGVVAPETYTGSGMMGSPTYTFEDLEHSVQQGLEAVIDGLPADISAETVCLTGDPAAMLGERSAALDLMLAGSRGYGPLRSVLVGGVSGRLIRTVQCPVIVIPRGVAAPLATLFGATSVIAI